MHGSTVKRVKQSCIGGWCLWSLWHTLTQAKLDKVSQYFPSYSKRRPDNHLHCTIALLIKQKKTHVLEYKIQGPCLVT